MILVIEKKTGFVAMRSDGPVQVDPKLFDVVEADPTKEERDRMEQNWHNWWKDGRLIQEPSPAAKKENEKMEKTVIIESVKSMMKNKDVGSADLASAISQLITLVEK